MFETLDALIATIGVVFVLSLIVQAVQQIIKQLFSFKSRYMRRELMAMFGAVGGPDVGSRPMEASALAAPLADAIARATPENADIVEVIDLLKRRMAGFGYNDLSLLETMSAKRFTDMLTSIARDLPEGTRASLRAAFDHAVQDAESWFDVTLRAFQDHYERRMKLWSYVLSFALVALLHVSLFEVFGEFQADPALREAAATSTQALVASYRPPAAPGAGGEATLREWSAAVGSQLSAIDSLVAIRSFQLWRWDAPGRDTLFLRGPVERSTLSYWWTGVSEHLGGLVLMALLVGLGAPFWYDILRAVTGLKPQGRGAGNGGGPPEPSRTVARPQPKAAARSRVSTS